jgi:ketosteroid isomerase-like protein
MVVGGKADKIDVARAMVEGFAARDTDRLLSIYAPDAEFYTRVTILPERDFKGHDAVREWLAAADRDYDRIELVDPEYVAGADDNVLMTCRLSLQYRGDNYGQSRIVYWVVRVDQDSGLITWFKSFRDEHEALEAAGLPS